MDGTSSVTITEPDTLTVSPLEMDSGLALSLGFVDKNYTNELDQVNKEHFRYHVIHV